MTDIKSQIKEDMKSAMKAKETERLGAIRLILAQVKQLEVDQRIEATDEHLLVILDKMCKQRRESIKQYQDAAREDLVAKEQFELEVIQAYLPQQLSEAEITDVIKGAVSDSGAESVKDMGKVMAAVKPKLQGRADMSVVSKLVKEALA